MVFYNMFISKVLFLSVFGVIFDYAMCNRERKMQEILDGVRKIEEHLTKEDRYREIADIVRIDSTVDKLNSKMDRILNLLETNPLPPFGRSDGAVMPRDFSSNMQAIQSRLENLESTAGKVEESMINLGVYSAKVNEIEQRTTQLKDDMNVKLRKMMNVLTALYEMNKEMKKDVETRNDEHGSPKPDSESNGYAAEFFMENLDELERKIREQFSLLTTEIRSEVTSLKIVAANSGASNCQTSSDDEEWLTPQNNARSIGNRGSQAGRAIGILDNLVETLGRSTREIRDDIQHGMQELDSKLENLTTLAQTQPTCGDLDTAESSMSRRRSMQPVSLPPVSVLQQSLDEKDKKRKMFEKSSECSKS